MTGEWRVTGTPPLFAGLVDDAAMFPPGNAPVPDAVAAHAGHRSAWYAGLVGPLLCAAPRLAELRDALPRDAAEGPPLRIGLIGTTGLDDLAAAVAVVTADGRLSLAGVEAPLGDDMTAGAEALAGLAPDGGAAYAEVSPAALDAALDAIAAAGVRAKLRTGGTTAAAHPDEDVVARFLAGCVARGLAFKCTAGLHHAVRNTDPVTGFEQHGFLNILLATREAAGGASATGLAVVLAERDETVVALAARDLAGADVEAVRAAFLSFGSCSVVEPVDDLARLGLVVRPVSAEGEQ